ncbi:MAG TPA: hypothetical protein DCZ94_09900 [Lentisphaeria bacterium]|nr:MAG: hypothetical protein A2X48_19135 [Lentisphaerae bacterium GWF2_49_21]HBC87256.1 hypothetical protein [Lentisphaeria bacterium]
MEVIVILILIFANGILALSEIAFVSARREILETFQSHGSRRAGKILEMMDEPEKFLSSIQVGITLVGVVSGAYGGTILAGDLNMVLKDVSFLSPYSYQVSLVFIVVAVTYISIVFGELIPKSIGLKDPEKMIILLFPITRILMFLAYPAVAVLSISTKIFLKLVGLGLSGVDQIADPIRSILGIAKSAVVRNKLRSEQLKIITNTMNVQDVRISDIMVGRDEIKYLSADMSLNKALVEAHIHHHTRYPIVEAEDVDRIIGYVNFKDIMNAIRVNPAKPTLRSICRRIVFVAETDNVLDVLPKLTKSCQHIAIVRSPSGSTAGLVSLENMLETIVGDIRDEFDILPEFIYELTENRWLAGGGLTLEKIGKVVDVPNFPESEKNLCQWLMEISDENPRVENRIEYGNLLFHVRKVSRSRIYEVIIEKLQKG